MPPDSGSYATAAYLFVAAIVMFYALRLWRRGR